MNLHNKQAYKKNIAPHYIKCHRKYSDINKTLTRQKNEIEKLMRNFNSYILDKQHKSANIYDFVAINIFLEKLLELNREFANLNTSNIASKRNPNLLGKILNYLFSDDQTYEVIFTNEILNKFCTKNTLDSVNSFTRLQYKNIHFPKDIKKEIHKKIKDSEYSLFRKDPDYYPAIKYGTKRTVGAAILPCIIFSLLSISDDSSKKNTPISPLTSCIMFAFAFLTVFFFHFRKHLNYSKLSISNVDQFEATANKIIEESNALLLKEKNEQLLVDNEKNKLIYDDYKAEFFNTVKIKKVKKNNKGSDQEETQVNKVTPNSKPFKEISLFQPTFSIEKNNEISDSKGNKLDPDYIHMGTIKPVKSGKKIIIYRKNDQEYPLYKVYYQEKERLLFYKTKNDVSISFTSVLNSKKALS